MHRRRKDLSLVIRNFTFGVEDSLVSTVGLLVGIAVADVSRTSIVITGLVLIFVEAFSMAVGSLLSEESVEEYQQKDRADFKKPIHAALIMFFSYVLAGLIPLSPFFYSASSGAIAVSIGLTLISLFMLGVVNAKLFQTKMLRDGLFTLIMGGIAIMVGVVVGQIAGAIG